MAEESSILKIHNDVPMHLLGRKRALENDDSHQLQAKISKERTKLIKVKVANDMKVDELNFKVNELEDSNEKQHKTIIQQQMEIESLKGEIRNELRQREELINVVNTTRVICSTLENHIEDLHPTLKACEADRLALHNSYQCAVDIINSNEERYSSTVEQLQNQVAAEKNLNIEKSEVYVQTKKVMEENIELLKCKISDQNKLNTALQQQRNEANMNSAKSLMNLEEKEQQLNDCLSKLQIAKDKHIELMQDHEKQILQFNQENTQLMQTLNMVKVEKDQQSLQIFTLENETKRQADIIDHLKLTLAQQCEATEALNLDNKQFKQQIYTLENENKHHVDVINDLRIVDKEIEQLKAEKQEASRHEAFLQEKCQELTKQLENLQKYLETTKLENTKAARQLNDELSQIKYSLNMEKVARLNADNETQALQNTKNDLEDKFKTFRNEFQIVQHQLKESNEVNNSRLDTVTALMAEVKSNTDIRTKLEESLKVAAKQNNESYELKLEAKENKIEVLKNEVNLMKNLSKKSGDEILDLKKHIHSSEDICQVLNREVTELKKEIEELKCAKNARVSRIEPLISIPEPVRATSETTSKDTSHSQKNTDPVWKMPFKSNISRMVKKKHCPVEKPEFDLFSDCSSDGYDYDPATYEKAYNRYFQNNNVSPTTEDPTTVYNSGLSSSSKSLQTTKETKGPRGNRKNHGIIKRK